MIKSKYFVIHILLLLCISSTALAQQTGLELLTIGPDSKALGLNQAVTAELLGASSLYTNPANLAFEYSSSLNASYTLWIGDLTHSHAAANLRKGSRSLAFGFLGSQINDIPLRGNTPGPSDGDFVVSTIALSGGYAYRMGPVALGGSLQYLREEYYIYNASGWAANIGASARFWDDRIHLGTSLLNMGAMNELRNEATPLPTTFRAGINAELLTFTTPQNQSLPITLYLKNDLVVPLQTTSGTTQTKPDNEVYTIIALEFNIADAIALRAGYNTGDTVRPWSTGAAIAVGSVTVNYALIPFETGYGTVHSMGLRYRF